jgi:hypothetical protein
MIQKMLEIRNLFTPVQPTVHQSAGAITYTEFLPEPVLSVMPVFGFSRQFLRNFTGSTLPN